MAEQDAMTTVREGDCIQSVADGFQFVSYHYFVDYIKALAELVDEGMRRA